MTIVDRYIAWQVFIGLIIATAVLLPLFSFFDLLDQLSDAGKGTYAVKDAFLYTAMLLPRRFIQIAPFIALLGTVSSLGKLAVNSELVALRVAGVSPIRISLVPLCVGLLFLVFIALLEQVVAPQFQQQAISYRAVALGQTAELGRDLGIWSRNEQTILRIGQMQNAQKAVDIEILRIDKEGFLLAHVAAESADIIDDELWQLTNVTVRTFAQQKIFAAYADSVHWQSFLNPEDIATLSKSAESLSPTELFKHVKFLRATGQEADSYALTLWRKAGGAVMTIAMLLLAIPFIFGSVRSGLGNKLVFAAVTGIVVYLADQIIANLGLIWGLNPAFVAFFPGVCIIIFAGFWLRRIF